MEPGHEDREYLIAGGESDRRNKASMEPGHEDREYKFDQFLNAGHHSASMEPGHEDREYLARSPGRDTHVMRPQWSPVMKTGNTRRIRDSFIRPGDASMEPGHEDREYSQGSGAHSEDWIASMEPGHEDREYRASRCGASQA